MKKLLAVMSGLVLGSALYAMPVLNPAEPALLTDSVFFCDNGCVAAKFGYRGDFVADRKLEDGNGRVSKFSICFNEALFTVNFFDRVDFYGFIGNTFNPRYENVIADTEIIAYARHQTVWGMGAKAVLFDYCWGNCGTSFLGVDVQYEGHRNTDPFERATVDGVNATLVGSGGFTYREFQASAGVSHKIPGLVPFFDSVVPYVAAKYSNARARSSDSGDDGIIDGTTITGMKSQQHWGIAFGATLVDANRMSVTGEARFIDETAFSVSAEFRF